MSSSASPTRSNNTEVDDTEEEDPALSILLTLSGFAGFIAFFSCMKQKWRERKITKREFDHTENNNTVRR